MQTKYINNIAAEDNQKAYYAYLNASTTNIANKSHFSNNAQLAVTRTATALSVLFCQTKQYVTYRKTLVSIKMCTKAVLNKKSLKQYEEYLLSENWEKAISAQGVIYTKRKKHFA